MFKKIIFFFMFFFAAKLHAQLNNSWIDYNKTYYKFRIAKDTLFRIWVNCIKILHPFMPFITEEIWSILKIENKKLLLVEKWPTTQDVN
jgi:valyl-tRNA synthetase